MKFVLFVEGDTERNVLPSFFKRWLDPRLKNPVGIKTVKFNGWPEQVKDSPTKAKLHLKDNDVIAVIALLDLYGPTFYPSNKLNVTERYEWAKGDLEKKVNHPRFRQFFAVHETEAWLLSQPDIFPQEIKTAFPGSTVNPEDVNFTEPPAKLLSRLYTQKTGRTYKKVTYGKDLFDKLDVSVAYEKCPQLKAMLNEMLKLAKHASL